jgi:iron complex transport system permease protein
LNAVERYAAAQERHTALWAAGAAAVALLASVLTGPDGFGLPAEAHVMRLVLLEIRLPRALLGAMVGAALGMSGAALQGYLRNPLAEPGLIGVTSGASLGAVIAIHTGAAGAFAVALPLGGLIGAALAAAAVLALSGARTGALTLILAGVAVSSVAGALTALAVNLSPNPFASVEIVFWMLGSLSDRSLVHVWLAGPFILAGLGTLMLTRSHLDALTLGEDAAVNLGTDLSRLRLLVLAGTASAVGAATAVAGAIGFVGLIVPHLLRPWVDHQPGRLLLSSALAGAALVLAADVVLRLLPGALDIRLGVATAIVGAPFFLWLVLKTRQELLP